MTTRNDIVINQGATFSTSINLVDAANNPLSLAGYTAASQMKRWYTSINSTTFTVAINATSGVIALSLPANVTANLVHGRYVYDVDLVDSANVVTRIVEGMVVVNPGVTNLSTETTVVTYNPNTDFIVVPLTSNTP